MIKTIHTITYSVRSVSKQSSKKTGNTAISSESLEVSFPNQAYSEASRENRFAISLFYGRWALTEYRRIPRSRTNWIGRFDKSHKFFGIYCDVAGFRLRFSFSASFKLAGPFIRAAAALLLLFFLFFSFFFLLNRFFVVAGAAETARDDKSVSMKAKHLYARASTGGKAPRCACLCVRKQAGS